MLIGTTRCSVICENTVLLETQGPCGSVRECCADTVTDGTGAQVEDDTNSFGGSYAAASRGCNSSCARRAAPSVDASPTTQLLLLFEVLFGMKTVLPSGSAQKMRFHLE